MKKLRVGIAGYGIVGQRRKNCMDNHPELEVVAVCDQSFEGGGIFSDGVHFYQSYQELLNEEIDVLFVCMTNDINPEATMAGLKRGLHVFCEKPPGRNLDDLNEVINIKKIYPDLCLMYGFNHRYHDSVGDALKILESGELGGIINLRGLYGKSKVITFNQSDWRTKREIAGGGVLLDQGIHMVDLMRLFAGEFVDVKSFVSNDHWGFDVEDNAYALMKTADGIVGILHSSATQWKHRFQLDISFEKGALSLGGLLTGSKSYGDETLTVILADHSSQNADPKMTVTYYNVDQSWEREINSFADFILRGKPVRHGSLSDAFNTMKLVYQIYCADSVWRTRFSIPAPSQSI